MAVNDFIAITPAQPLAPGKAQVRITYSDQVSRDLTDGIFQQKDGEDWYVLSEFEPVTVRRAFPCSDEPSFKTPWQLMLRIPGKLQAFSNAPTAAKTAEQDGTKVVRFARTKHLPSCLIALVIGPFEVIEAGRVGRKRRCALPSNRLYLAACRCCLS